VQSSASSLTRLSDSKATMKAEIDAFGTRHLCYFHQLIQGEVLIRYNDKTGYMRSSQVTCICDKSYTGKPGLKALGEVGISSYDFELTHACCCKDVCKEGMPAGGGALSGGSILLILVFVLAAVYLIVGGIFMKYKKGAIGSEIIPNKSFWTEFPSLMKDGLMFMTSPCTKRSSYNQV